jgi:hypothetical protein
MRTCPAAVVATGAVSLDQRVEHQVKMPYVAPFVYTHTFCRCGGGSASSMSSAAASSGARHRLHPLQQPMTGEAGFNKAVTRSSTSMFG